MYAFEFLTYRSLYPDKTLLELLCDFSTDQLIFVKYDSCFFASYKLTTAVYDTSGLEIARAGLVDSVRVDSFEEMDLPSSRLIQFSFLIDPGLYDIEIKLLDLETLKGFAIKKQINVPVYQDSLLQLSDLQIARSITPSDKYDEGLVKNGRQVIPNVLRALQLNSDLYFYFEIYNLYYSLDGGMNKFAVNYRIANQKQDRVIFRRKEEVKPAGFCSFSASISTITLEPDLYTLTLTVEDLDNGQTATKSTNFMIIQ